VQECNTSDKSPTNWGWADTLGLMNKRFLDFSRGSHLGGSPSSKVWSIKNEHDFDTAVSD
jgi:hypothetical protein